MRTLAVLFAATLAAASAASEPCPDRDPLRRPHFGDLHVHTSLSLDASTQDTRGTPADAYRFARGESIGLQPYDAEGRSGRRTQLERPLDFAAVTDHAELLGEVKLCRTPGLPGYDSLVCSIYRSYPRAAFYWMNFVANTASRHDFCGEAGGFCRNAARGPWEEIQRAAEGALDRCRFTSFVGYEWTGAEGAGNNMHRNVIFNDATVPELPASFIETPTPPALWRSLRRECVEADGGCDVVVIPHNSNLGAGRMFRTIADDGSAIDAEEARGRADFERLVEVMQHKGSSECHPSFSNDELCGFEKLAYSNFAGHFVGWLAEDPLPNQFVRHVLAQGLELERRLGVNPFRFGVIASTDTHLATPGLVTESARYPGHGGAGPPIDAATPTGLPDAPEFNPGGLAVLWAEENTRAALFAAMKRRETYGTSGPRIEARFFGGWTLGQDLCDAPGALSERGYAEGVPMGGTLPARGDSEAPVFAVAARRDPGTERNPGTPLERIQIVKGWIESGEPRERVFDLARSGGDAGVDPATCATHGAGADELCAVWRDPDFDPAQRAVYYARAVEHPTCRWSQHVCVARGVRCDDPASIAPGLEACCAPEHAPTVRERAWTSPIWYTP